MKKIIKVLFLVLLLSSIHNFTHADEITTPECVAPQILVDNICTDPTPPTPTTTTIHLKISDNSGDLYNQNIDVSSCDSDNPNAGILKTTPYCAILQSGLQSDWNTAWAPGIFLNSINNIAGFTSQDSNGNDVYHYWSWSLNGTEATVGLNQYELQANDLISLTFIDPIETPIDPPVTTHHTGGGGGSTIVEPKKIFNIEKAFEFLISKQKENGTFENELYTDWATIALMSTDKYQDTKIKLIKYYSSNNATGENLTDYERRAMALMSLGLNPYNTNGINYIEKITKEFDGTQFGDKENNNDDIFALIVLQNAGYKINDEIIQKTIEFILSKQKEDGSWDDNVDMTSAGIEALGFANENFLLRGVSQADEPRGSAPLVSGDSDLEKEEFSLAKIKTSIDKAKKYLKDKQKEDGSWENVSSTAWAVEGIIALGEKTEDWKKNEKNPSDYLAENQDTDGGIKNDNLENRIWQTSYVLTSLSGKTWNEIMQKFDKKIVEVTKEEIKITKAPIVKKEVKKIIAKKEVKKIENIPQTQTATALNAFDETKNNKTGWFRKIILTLFNF